jgi:uncharacterized protein (TIGR02246 family)
VASLASPNAATREGILRLVSGIEDAFNRHDLDAFMDSYANAPDVEYVFQGRAVRGIEAIRREYSGAFFPADSGTQNGPPQSLRLHLVVAELNTIGKDCAVATLRILLGSEAPGVSDAAGTSTIVVRRIHGRWRIVYDHSSMVETTGSSQ